MLRQIDIQDLQPGMVIVKVTEQNGPVKIKKSGLVTSQDMVQGLIEMGILQVEIDTDQTVEITSAKVKKSPTQRMLENNTVSHTRIDDGMSEQLHRSLFLSSVQDIPPPWLFYTKRYMLAGLLIVGGLGLGWTLANYPLMLQMFISNSSKTELAVVNTPQAIKGNVTSTAEQVNTKNLPVQQEVTTAPITLNADSGTNPSTSLAPESTANQQDTTSEVALDVSPEPEIPVNISPGLLQKFEQAISEVEVIPQSTPKEVPVSEQDVPRIDQLPAWVMTRLPSMAFSAHMYASQASERWVRVNGTRMIEGDKIDGLIEIIRIEPQHIILNYSGQTFSMAALTDW
jgi:general secretion pathway protein B